MNWLTKQTSGDSPASGKPVPPKAAPGSRMPPSRWLTFLLILGANYLLMRYFLPEPDAPVTVPYTAFKAEVTNGNVEAVYGHGEAIEGRFVKPISWPPPKDKDKDKQAAASGDNARRSRPVTTFKTTLPFFLGPGLEALLIEKGVEIRAEPIQTSGGAWTTLLVGFGPALLIIGFYFWTVRRAMRQGAD